MNIGMLFALLLTVAFPSCVAAAGTISIESPKDGAKVPERPAIEGKVSDAAAKVWVVVHPMNVGDFWVQPVVTTKSGGTWKVLAYVGRPGNVDVGKQFEVRAFANPKSKLREGDVLPDWPEAEAQSDVIEITRQ